MPEDKYYVMDESGRLSEHREAGRRHSKEPPTRIIPSMRGGRNPALAFTYSLLCWGGGQLHNLQMRMGVVFILLMAAFYLFVGLIAAEGHDLSMYLQVYEVSGASVAKIFIAVYFSGIILWAANAVQAYNTVRKKRMVPFDGVKLGPVPALASLLVPGWGQFLNGQFAKGIFFILGFVGGMFAAGVFLATPVFWPHLVAAPDRLFWETSLLIALAGAVVYFVCCPLSVYDALRVSLDPAKKEPLLKRLNYAWNRRKVFGFRRGVMPQFRTTLILTLIFSISLLLGVYFMPRDYYAAKVRQVSLDLRARNMTLIPDMAGRLLSAMGEDPQDLQTGTDHG